MEITVSVHELLCRAQEMSADGMDFVTLSIAEADPEEDLPAALMFEAWSNAEAFMCVQYDAIYAEEVSD